MNARRAPLTSVRIASAICFAVLLAGSARTSRMGTAISDIRWLEAGLQEYKHDVGVYPTIQEGLAALDSNPGVTNWHGPYFLRRSVPGDPWGNPYRYTLVGDHPKVHSYGPDGSPDTEDDINAMSQLNVGLGCSGPRQCRN